ncbi:hypothetical protein V3C99_005486 [Haemonchus contortus]
MGLRSLLAKLLLRQDSSDANNRSQTTPVKEIKPFTAGTMKRGFSATVADELTLPKGSKVKAMYCEDEWLYVHSSDGKHGFVPQTYCTLTVDRKPSRPPKVTKSSTELTRRISRKESDRRRTLAVPPNHFLHKDLHKSSLQRFLDSLPVEKERGRPFNTEALGKATMRHRHIAFRSGDLTVRKGQQVTILNIDDPDWTFVRTAHGREGFVPSYYLDYYSIKSRTRRTNPEEQLLLVTEDFYGQHVMDISVKQGEWVRVLSKDPDGWLWVRRLRNGKEGFLPSRIAIVATNV